MNNHYLAKKKRLNDKEKWIELCEVDSTIPIFMHAWWMDIVCGKDQWQIVLSYSNKGTIIGALAYHFKKKWGLSIITIPPYTPFSGIWFKAIDSNKTHSFHSTRKKITTDLIQQLPNSSTLDLKLHHSNDNWLPFKWAGFSASTHYTHTIDLTQSEEEIWAGFKSSTRSKIQKSKDEITLEEMNSFDEIRPLVSSIYTYKRVGNEKYLTMLLENLDNTLKAKNQRRIWVAKNKSDEIIAYLYLIWDKQSSYYLAGGTNPNNRKSNAMYALFWEAMIFSKAVVPLFDFEGSVIPQIERVFKSFGAMPRPYFRLSRSPTKLMQIARIILGKNG